MAVAGEAALAAAVAAEEADMVEVEGELAGAEAVATDQAVALAARAEVGTGMQAMPWRRA
jgi:hypothetical protein